jgi:RHS repeat-associated protein
MNVPYALRLRQLAGLLTLCTFSAQSTAISPITEYQYDAQGNLRTIKTPLGRTTTNTYDALNRLETSTAPAVPGLPSPIVTRYAYDGLDQLRSVTDPKGVPTGYTVDGLGNQTQEVSRDRGTTKQTFDTAGNLESRTDGRGKKVTYKYDALNRLTQTKYKEGTADRYIKYFYDEGANGIGRLTRITFPPTNNGGNSTVYTYDIHGNVVTKTDNHNSGKIFQVKYDWNSTTGQLHRITYPSGKVLHLRYDDVGQVEQIEVEAIDATVTSIATNITYVPFGPPQSWRWGDDGTLNIRSFDTDGRMESFRANSTETYQLIYDDAGRIKEIKNPTDINRTQLIGYDPLDRITGWSKDVSNRTYTYDANGNREFLEIGGNPYDYTIAPDSNRLLTTAGPGGNKTYSYDNAGNTIEDTQATYIYNDLGRMIEATKGSTTVKYTYDGLGQRVKKSGGGTSYYVYDEGGQLIGTYDSAGNVVQEYVYLRDMPIAVLTGTTNPMVYYVYTDQVMRPWTVTNVFNDKVWEWDTSPFGEGNAKQNPSKLGNFVFPLRFPGQHHDKETGLFYNYFRDYDPQTGRYLQSDPIGYVGGINSYVYVGNIPLQRIDPYGLIGNSPSSGMDPTIACKLIERVPKPNTCVDSTQCFKDAQKALQKCSADYWTNPVKKVACVVCWQYIGGLCPGLMPGPECEKTACYPPMFLFSGVPNVNDG